MRVTRVEIEIDNKVTFCYSDRYVVDNWLMDNENLPKCENREGGNIHTIGGRLFGRGDQ